MKKLYDLAVKTGEYTDREGNTKGNWLNVGTIMEKDNKGRIIFMDRTFNPAGVPNPDNRSNIIVSMFEPKNKQDAPPVDDAPPPDDGDIPF